MEVYLDWICQAWDVIPKCTIEKSFKDCGITVSLDGSEDDMIHCFKQHGPVPEGREMLREARIANAEIDLTNEPEEDLGENYEN
ncbi:hypothetical protein DdX_19530 [Ditylenchus destructor]|uniref:Uncharacterized protein n=1 Tax=Ditylenchus destructor TaxID=166010 RepID=A0AAD4MKA1_9BILA|nr:hypothetical protein DdX_19530 [Ditylenchus destructor]